jgi:hypothetical protein
MRFEYSTSVTNDINSPLRPLMPLVIASFVTSSREVALVDSGSDVNVLPYRLGRKLGLVWENHAPAKKLGGVVNVEETRLIRLGVKIGDLPIAELVFAWANSDRVPLVLSMTDFFLKFNVCFFRSQSYFEVLPKSGM